MIKTADSVYVDAPVDTVYEYCSDPEKWPELAPAWGHMELTNVKKVPGLTGSTWDGATSFLGLVRMHESFEVLEAEPGRRLVLSGEGTMGKETTTFLLQTVDGGTVLTMLDEREEMAAERLPVVGRVASGVVNWFNALWMHELKTRLQKRGAEAA